MVLEQDFILLVGECDKVLVLQVRDRNYSNWHGPVRKSQIVINKVRPSLQAYQLLTISKTEVILLFFFKSKIQKLEFFKKDS